jgi:septum formation protein
MEPIVLASQSPRRRQLLEWAEIPFDIIVKQTGETYPPGLGIEEIPVFIARNKALVVKKDLNPERVVLAADTIVVLGEEIIGKPKDREEALGILEKLSGKRHLVITGVVILKNDLEINFADITEVWFHELSRSQIAYYVDKYKPYDKAGAYAIQEWIGVTGIRRINGDFYNVMGLPVSRVIQKLSTL